MSLLFKMLCWLSMPMMQVLGRMIASIIASIPNASPNKNVKRNIQLVFPTLSKAEQQVLAKQALQNQAMSLLEFIKIWGSNNAYGLAQINTVTGESILHRALQNPRGCIAIVPHFGSWEVMNAWISQFSQPVMMYKPFRSQSLDRFVRLARSQSKAQLVTADEAGVRQIFKALKQGGFTIILPDHIPHASGGIDAPFMGYPVLSSTLVSKLASKTGCAVIQLSCIRAKTGFDVTVQALEDGINDSNLLVSVTTLNQSIEKLIQQHPTHYHWTYKRFKPVKGLEEYYYGSDADAALIIKNYKH